MLYKDYIEFNNKLNKIFNKLASKLNFNILENSEFFCFFDQEASEEYQATANLHYSDDKIDLVFYISLVDNKYYYNYFYTELVTGLEIIKTDTKFSKFKNEDLFNIINSNYLLQ